MKSLRRLKTALEVIQETSNPESQLMIPGLLSCRLSSPVNPPGVTGDERRLKGGVTRQHSRPLR